MRGNKLMIKKKVNESGSLEELKEPKERLPELLFGHGQFYKEYNSVEFTPELTKKLVEIALEYADEDEEGSDNSPAVEVRDA